jgi:mono/diheme cytochrome c family protein
LISAGTSVKTDAELLAVIANGKPRTSMPAWKDLLTEEQRRDVLAYIRTLVRFGPKPLTPPPPLERH